jgi:hypothetical protein
VKGSDEPVRGSRCREPLPKHEHQVRLGHVAQQATFAVQHGQALPGMCREGLQHLPRRRHVPDPRIVLAQQAGRPTAVGRRRISQQRWRRIKSTRLQRCCEGLPNQRSLENTTAKRAAHCRRACTFSALMPSRCASFSCQCCATWSSAKALDCARVRVRDAAQLRMQARMAQWAPLTPTQRAQVSTPEELQRISAEVARQYAGMRTYPTPSEPGVRWIVVVNSCRSIGLIAKDRCRA